ncbi:MarR family winged helix-turn-helix transcriptional regulator [Nocardioides sp. CFH 31398]|uniref:MarR family winged helix-turn-helix transcriptional regulator n=1 Tax=Nocardioides sp. CFH 31398 TaxID=2919579 RepID=UPI001F057F48|nr:MarR family transcriptional regulator [Nocardioides sp. CFH 31398]MCH1864951.1 MarR family transcriptional regulator [Nocardioides sp. CFH 31398]
MGKLDEGAGLRLDDQLCFAVYAAANAIVRSYRPRLAAIGLTYPQYLVMLTLWQDGDAPVGRVAARLELDSHAVSPLVDRLEAAGLVSRGQGDDRRQVVVRLTAAGRPLEAEAARVQSAVQCDTGLSPTELATLRGELRALAGRLAAPVPPPTTPPGEGEPS